MKIVILVLSASNNFGEKGTYNLQEVGLAKELSDRGHHVFIYKCIHDANQFTSENICEGVKMYYVPVKTIGQHSLFCPSVMDCNVDAMVCFSDNQIFTPKVYRWAKNNNVIFIPYVGCIESTSPNALKRFLMDKLFNLTCHIYRSNQFLAKTNYVCNILKKKGIEHTDVASVGLDFELLNEDYKKIDRKSLKRQWGYNDEKIILMVGRLENDRNPMDCIPVFKKIYQTDSTYRFLIIGNGSLKERLKDRLRKIGILDSVDFIEQIPNKKMWEIYHISDYMVSFSHTEIFGMSILEAMYYEKPVFALHAPGPDDIIEDGETGYLFDSSEQMANDFFHKSISNIGKKGREKIITFFTWKKTADKIEKIVCLQRGRTDENL